MKERKGAFKKALSWAKENRWWLRITGVLAVIVLGQRVALKSEHKWNADLLNKLLDVTKDPDKYAEDRIQDTCNLLAEMLENSMEGDVLSKESVGDIVWGLKNDWHNFLYD